MYLTRGLKRRGCEDAMTEAHAQFYSLFTCHLNNIEIHMTKILISIDFCYLVSTTAVPDSG